MSNFVEAERRINQNRLNCDPDLDLSSLSLSEIPASTFELRHLEKLALTNNDLAVLDHRMVSLHRLQILGLNYNRLSSLPIWMGDMRSLRSLDCWNNAIATIPPELAQLERLEYLTLGFNKLEEIPRELFQFLSRLKALDLQSNPFTNMPAIRDMELFDLMAYFRSESSFYGFVEVPTALSTVCQQFLNFFPEYVRRVTGNKLSLDVTHTKSGLKLTTAETVELDITSINSHLEDYLKTLLPTRDDSHNLTCANGVESELLTLQIKLQVQHFRSQLEVLQFENRYLKNLVDNLVHVQGIMAKNPTPLCLTVNATRDNDTEELLAKLRDLVAGNNDATSLYEELAEEVKSDVPNQGKIKRLWGQLSEKSPTVLAVVEIVKNVFGF